MSAREPEGAVEILAYLVIKDCCALLVLALISVTMLTCMGLGNLPGVAEIVLGELLMILLALRLFYMRRWAAIVLPLALWCIALLDLRDRAIPLTIIVATMSFVLTLAILIVRRSLRPGF